MVGHCERSCVVASRKHTRLSSKKKIRPSKKGKEKMIESKQGLVNPGNHSTSMEDMLPSDGKELAGMKKKSELSCEIKRLEEADNALKETVKAKKETVKAKKECITDLKDRTNTLVAELDALEKRRIKSEEERSLLRKTLERLEYDVNQCESTTEKMLIAQNQLEEQHRDLQVEMQRLQRQNEAQRFYINDTLQDLNDALQDLISLPNGEELMEILMFLSRDLF